MAGRIRIGTFLSNAPSDDATDFVDFDNALPHIQGAVTALNAQPRPNAQAIRSIVLGVLTAVDNPTTWQSKSDEWFGLTALRWFDFGLSARSIENIAYAMGLKQQ